MRTPWTPPAPPQTKQLRKPMHPNQRPAANTQMLISAHTETALSRLSAHTLQGPEVCVRQPHVHTCIRMHARCRMQGLKKKKKKHAHLDRLEINGRMGWAPSCSHAASSCLKTLQCITTAREEEEEEEQPRRSNEYHQLSSLSPCHSGLPQSPPPSITTASMEKPIITPSLLPHSVVH